MACRYEALRRRTCGTCRCWELGDSVENVSFGACRIDDLSVAGEGVVIGVWSYGEISRWHRYLRYVWCVDEALLGACLRNCECCYLQGWLPSIAIGSINREARGCSWYNRDLNPSHSPKLNCLSSSG